MRNPNFAAVVVCVGFAAVVYAASPSPERDAQQHEPASTNARFTIHGDGTSRILLDTNTGDTWAIRAMTNMPDSDMRGWFPIPRVGNVQLEAWLKRSFDEHDRFIANLNADHRDQLRERRAELGDKHPEVLAMQREMAAIQAANKLEFEDVLKAFRK